jgi:hypothetical protein
MTKEDLAISKRNAHRLIAAARQSDEALQAEANRLYPKTPSKAT